MNIMNDFDFKGILAQSFVVNVLTAKAEIYQVAFVTRWKLNLLTFDFSVVIT